MIRWIDKDPDAVAVEYELDFGDAIGADDALVSTAWDAPSALLLEDRDPIGNVARIAISGGVAGEVYVVNCAATLDSGQVIPKGVMLKVRQQ